MELDTPIETIVGAEPKLVSFFEKKNIKTVQDALYFFPHRYEDRRLVRKMSEIVTGMKQSFFGRVVHAENGRTKGGRPIFKVTLDNDGIRLYASWLHFNPKSMHYTWVTGRTGVFFGMVDTFNGSLTVMQPEVEWDDERDPDSPRILPVYPLSANMSQRNIQKIMQWLTDEVLYTLESPIPSFISDRHGLMYLPDAVKELHTPQEDVPNADTPAVKTLVFDDFFYLSLGLELKKREARLLTAPVLAPTYKLITPLAKTLPFNLTNAQKRVLGEIRSDLSQPRPMNRLIQGDVGSGKTMVALFSALMAIENGYQVTLVAPTEILAEQHYFGFKRYCETLGVKTSLLVSSLKAAEKKRVLADIASGATALAIGTHALLQEQVKFARLGLGIVDEQHRFGVEQRAILRKKGDNPHILVMTATPIPRTLALVAYGDLSLSIIDELPPGRSPITTVVWPSNKVDRVFESMKRELAAGRQAYVVYPLVEESEKSDLRDATKMAETLSLKFPQFKTVLVHGKMKQEEKESVMASFRANEAQILVATTIIEVGVDVPNATVMIIEHAERFGLAQLHQLRGRVGRGQHKSYCILVSSAEVTPDGEKRLAVMAETQDGFRIAEADLQIRGAGEFMGTRQSGMSDLRVGDIAKDGQIMEAARGEAVALLEKDPALDMYQDVKNELQARWGGKLEMALVA